MEENNNTTQDILNQVHESTPDSIHPLLDYLLKNGKLIASAIVAIIIIAAGFSTYQYMGEQDQLKAQSELGAILIKHSGAKQAEALAAFGKKAPSEMKPAVQLALAKAWMDAKDFTKAEVVWAALAKENKELAPVAKLGTAKCMMLANKPAEAVNILQDLKEKSGNTFGPTINRMLADAAEKSGNIQLAIQAYQGLLTSNPNEKAYLEGKIKELKNKL